MKTSHSNKIPLLTLAAMLLSAAGGHAFEAVLSDDTMSNAVRPTATYGAAKALGLRSGQKLYFKFNLSNLPPGTTSAQVTKATVKIWMDRVVKAGVFDVFPVTGAWQEATLKASALPALGMVEIPGVPVGLASAKKFLTLDLTALVKDWLDGSVTNNGIALISATGSPILAFIPSKEDVATGHLVELEVSLAGTSLPFTQSGNSGSTLFVTTNAGDGAAVEGDSFSTSASISALVGTVISTSPGGFSAGVRGINNGTGGLGIGVYGSQAGSGWGVYGVTPNGIGVHGSSANGFGVYGVSTNGVGTYGTSTNGTGVSGMVLATSGATFGVTGQVASPSGIAVQALYSGAGVGTALEVNNGAIRVAGTNKAAFVHTATAANKLSANGTDVDNPLCNGDSTCLLFVTQHLNPSGIVYNNSPVGVSYNTIRDKWEIFNENNVAIPNNAQFNVLVIKQ